MGNAVCSLFSACLAPGDAVLPSKALPPILLGQSSNQLAYNCPDSRRKPQSSWSICRPALFVVLIICLSVISGFFMDWLNESGANGFEWSSVFKFGSIPIIAGLIGYATNVVALWMMFWPIEFIGCFPQLKLGPPLDFYLCGYQGVIPMKAEQMARISYEMMSTKLIKAEEIFARIDPHMMHTESEVIMPGIISGVLERAALKAMPEVWGKVPDWLRKGLAQRTVDATKGLLFDFIEDLKGNINDVFDLEHCVVSLMVSQKRVTNSVFFECGREELEFIKITGFYLGYVFGILQMIVWLFLRSWWILPACGLVVGFATNEIALKAIFTPANPIPICAGAYTIQGLFLKRQQEVAPIYAKKVATEIVNIDNMIEEMCSGAKCENLHKLVDRHVSHCLEEQIGRFKKLLTWSIGPGDLENFKAAACEEFWGEFRNILINARDYMVEAMQLETTIAERMSKLPPKEFERLLHSVFEQDEFKLVLVGALLGAIVGLLQALAQEPKQLGLPGW